eukprot:Seg1574.5 transcript_id=Seg1574.5/GoldUCD/mRNA.D3Y31 product="putative ATP-dependent RNA helicase DHX37" protein_id=Seg1574.5/GoldUCD/D3Y31
MGKLSKAKTRSQPAKQVEKRTEDDKAAGLALLDLGSADIEYNSVAQPNKMVITNNKEKKLRSQDVKQKKQLSNKQRKKLEKVIEKKKKKAKRSDLLKSLSEYQITEKELALYQPISSIGQSRLEGKRKAIELDSKDLLKEVTKDVVSSGRKRAKKLRMMKKLEKLSETNVVAAEEDQSSSSESESDSDIEKDVEIKKESHLSSIKENDSSSNIDVDSNEHVTNTTEIVQPCNQEECKETAIQTTNEKVLNPKQKKKLIPPKKSSVSKPAVFVEVMRRPEIQAARVLLPILAEEQSIMETISENNVVLICGETGSGKTTQVPQFLYEAGYAIHSPHEGIIGITEPRRVAAISMSKRVAEEMNLDTSVVSYQIRYEGNATNSTRMKFMTDGVLLKEMETDFLLTKYSVIIIDEAHERSVFTDILIGLLSRVVPLRNKEGNPMKLIIMSATLRIEDFVDNKRLFPSPPPVLKVDSRQYPVTIHFNKRTPDDYVTEAFKKVCKIHRTLKSGGILVFVTGQNEVQVLCRKLRRTFSSKDGGRNRPVNVKETGKEKKRNEKDGKLTSFNLDNYPTVSKNGIDYDDDFDHDDCYGADEESVLSNKEDDMAYDQSIDSQLPLHVLPLYSLLSSAKQAKVFEPIPDGTRLCVIATNVAETSLTIPGIKYVIDSGKVKTRFYDKLTGVSSFRVTWTSKASANQRAGRAGRVEPGHCYRLYSSAVFQHDFVDFSEAEICRRPADELLLLMKNMGIEKVKNFPFPTPPDSTALQAAENHLLDLDALEKKKIKKGGFNTAVTLLGRTMGQLPVSPRYSKMILLAHQQNCIQYMIIIVAALTVKEIFTDDIKIDDDSITKDEDGMKKKRMMITQARRKWAGTGETSMLGDMMVILRAFGACEYAGYSEQFCRENGLRYKAMIEIRKLRAQLSKAVNSVNSKVDIFVEPKITPPTETQAKVIRQILLSCLGDRVARKIPQSEIKDAAMKNAYQSCSTADPVFIHPVSSLFHALPEYIVYQEIIETSKLYMRGITAIEEDWLALFAPYKCTFSKPLDTIKPRYDVESGKMKCHMTCTFGPHCWSLPAQELDFPHCIDRFKWFAMSFLEGNVCEALREFVPYLLTPASVMIKTWAKLQPRTEVLLKEFLSENVSERKSLVQMWKKDEKYLLTAYLQWTPESLHEQIRSKWPRIA